MGWKIKKSLYHIKREGWFGVTNLNVINSRRLMGEHEVIVNDIHDIFININKGTITEDSINNVCDTHK